MINNLRGCIGKMVAFDSLGGWSVLALISDVITINEINGKKEVFVAKRMAVHHDNGVSVYENRLLHPDGLNNFHVLESFTKETAAERCIGNDDLFLVLLKSNGTSSIELIKHFPDEEKDEESPNILPTSKIVDKNE